MKHFWFLFAAYTIIWTAMFAYIVNLSRKNRELRDELGELRGQLHEHVSGDETS